MPPACYYFQASQLEEQVQKDVHGKRRKHADPRTRKIDLSACEFFEMLQYNCEVQQPVTPQSVVQCFTVPRAFRRCKDKKGTFTVETTAWEGTEAQKNPPPSCPAGGGNKAKPVQWSTGWTSEELQG